MRRILILLCVLVLSPAAALAQTRDGMTLEQIANLRAVSQFALSPDGTETAYVLSVPRTPGVDDDGPAWAELHVVDRAGSSRPFVTGEVNVGGVRWFPDGEAIAYLARRAGDDSRSLHRIPARGGEGRRLASLDSDIVRFDLSPDGRRAALLATAPFDDATRALRDKGFSQNVYEEDWRPVQLWIQTLSDDEAEPRLVEVEGTVLDVHWSPAGDRLALVVAPRQLTDDTMVDARVRIVAPDGRELGRVDNPGKLGDLAWSPDGEHLAIVSAEDIHDPREGRLTVVGKDGGAQRDLLPGLEGHVWSVAWREPGRVAFISHEGTRSRVGEIGVDGGGERTLLPLGERIWTSLSASRNGELAVRANAASHPEEVYLLPTGADAAQRLTDSNPWLADVRLARQETIRYTARDGLEIEGVLFHPLERRGNARVPLILVVHGGPEAHYSDGWLSNYSQPAQYAAARGFALFFPNYRASTGRGVEFSKLNHGRPAQEEFDDLVDGVEHLVETGLVDRARVGITGGSYGGYASAWGATRLSEHFAASVMFVGIADQISLFGTGDIPRELYLVHFLTWPWEDWDMYVQSSPIHHAHLSNTPTLILHGEADPRVPVGQGHLMYRYLKLAGNAPVRLVTYPGEGHGNARAASRWDYSLRLMQWMEHYLMGEGGEPPPYQIDYRLPGGDEDGDED